MNRAKISNTFLLLLTIIVFSVCPRFCRAQNNSAPSNPCETYGECGPFGSCDSSGSPICTCLRGFYPRNNQEWSSGNWTSGCLRSVPLSCEGGNNGTINGTKQDGFLKLQTMKVSGYTGRWIGPQTGCEGRCLGNCSCLAYGYDVGIGCIFWDGTLMDIQKFPGGSGSDLHIRVSNSELDQKKGSNMKIIVILVVVTLVILSICAFFAWKLIAKHRGKRIPIIELGISEASGSVDTSIQDALNQVDLEDLPLFKFEVLANATDHFSEVNKLGTGGFGPVYKAVLANGREVAVKRLSQASRQGMHEFMNEVMLISKLQHRNLVRLLGCCVENKETMLVYEYLPNKSLDFYLFDPSQEVLDWRKRVKIIEGICRGLLYLHRDSRLKIIHRDLKPSNILLDDVWNPKISDFGMARVFGTKQDHVSTVRVVGTYGYMAPEYAMEGRFSERSDVYSLGVLILEIAIGRRNTSFYRQDDSFNLLGHVWKLWTEDNVGVLIDPRISSLSYRAEVMRCIHIGLLCVQELPIDRPSVSAVLSMLRSEIMELTEPKQSAFSIKSSHSNTGTSSSQQNQSSSSVNDMTVSMVDGR